MKFISRGNRLVRFCIKTSLFLSASKIKSKHFSNNSDLVDYVFKVNTSLPRMFFYPLTPDQDKAEVLSLIEQLQKRRIKNILEVGTGFGGMSFIFSKVATKDAKLFTVDSGTNSLHRFFLQRLVGRKQRLLDVSLDSHKQKTFGLAESFFGGEPVDLLYIDGDHKFESVQRDFELYSFLVRRGGLIVFHDIADSKLGVAKFWRSLPKENRSEIVGVNFADKYGTGVYVK